jgi:hypothetical protein
MRKDIITVKNEASKIRFYSLFLLPETAKYMSISNYNLYFFIFVQNTLSDANIIDVFWNNYSNVLCS